MADETGVVDNVVLWDGVEAHEEEQEDGTVRVVGWIPPNDMTVFRLNEDSTIGPGDLVDATGQLIERGVTVVELSEVDVLTAKLVAKGVLTQAEADELATSAEVDTKDGSGK